MERKITRKKDIEMLFVVDGNVSIKKLKGKLMSQCPLIGIRRRGHATTMEWCDMWRKCVGRRDDT